MTQTQKRYYRAGYRRIAPGRYTGVIRVYTEVNDDEPVDTITLDHVYADGGHAYREADRLIDLWRIQLAAID